MHIDPQVIVFLFGLAIAIMFVVIYDLYEKLQKCEATINALQATVGDGKLVASILDERLSTESETIEPQPETPSTPLWNPYTRIELAPVPDKRIGRNNKRRNGKGKNKRRNKRS